MPYQRGSSWACERVLPSSVALEEEPILVTTILPSSPLVATERGDYGIVRVSAWSRRSHSTRTSLLPPLVTNYIWVRGDILKYRSSISFVVSVTTLER